MFDQQKQSGGTSVSPTEVVDDMPLCMQRSYGDTMTGSQNLDIDATQPAHRYYYNTPYDYPALTKNFDIKPCYRRWIMPGSRSILHAAIPYSFQVGQEYRLNAADPGSDSDQNLQDEVYYSWRKKYGPLYLFRIRGHNVWNTTEQVAPIPMSEPPVEDYKIPHQGINFGSAMVNTVTHTEMYCNMISYPEEPYVMRSNLNLNLTLMDNFPFLSEGHTVINQPQTASNPIPPPPM